MTDFAFRVEGDASKADKAIEDVLGKLDKVEAEAAQAGRALAKAFDDSKAAADAAAAAAKRSADAHERLSRQSQPIVQGFAKLNEMFEREKRLLDEIHGPMREYSSDLAALDQLLHRNAISTEQYTDRVAKLNRTIEQTPEPKGPTASSGAGAIAGTLGLTVAGLGATVLGVGHSIESLIEESHQLADAYTQLSNHALKFADKNKTVNQVLAEQAKLANALHSTLAPTIDLYDAVGDATDDLGLSQRELIALTQTLGEGAILAGKNLDAAGNVMGRLAMAMTAGAGGARDIQRILRDFPELGDALAAAWDTDTKGVVKFVSEGSKSLRDITQVWIHQTDSIHTAAAKRKRLYEDEAKVFHEEIVVGIGQGMTQWQATWNAAGVDVRKFDDLLRGLGTNAQPVADVVGKITEQLRDQVKEWEAAQKAIEDTRIANAKFAETVREIAQGGGFAVGLTGLETNNRAASLKEEATGLIGAHIDALKKRMEAEKEAAKHADELTEAEKRLLEAYRARLDLEIAADQRRMAQKRIRDAGGIPMLGGTTDIAIGPAGLDDQVTAERAREGEIAAIMREVQTPVEKYIERMEYLHKLQDSAQIDAALFGRAQRKAWEDAFGAAETARVNELTKSWQERMQRNQEANEQFAASFSPIGDAMQEAFTKGEVALDSLSQTLRQVSFNLFKFMALQAAASLTGSGQGFFGALVGGIFGGAHAHGGTLWEGSGGTDSQLYAIRKSPNERVTIETPPQYLGHTAGPRTAYGSGGGPVSVGVFMKNDETEITSAFHGAAGETAIAAVVNRKWRTRNR